MTKVRLQGAEVGQRRCRVHCFLQTSDNLYSQVGMMDGVFIPKEEAPISLDILKARELYEDMFAPTIFPTSRSRCWPISCTGTCCSRKAYLKKTSPSSARPTGSS